MVVTTQSFVHDVPVVKAAISSLNLEEVWSQSLDGGFGDFVEVSIARLEEL